MFILHENAKHQMPIKVWLDRKEALEKSCLQQAENLSRLPFIHKWVALMPDTHTGMGMPIGGVIATKNVVVPNAVGKDIGCGMVFASTDLDAKLLRDTMTKKESLLTLVIHEILTKIPTGFDKHKEPQESSVIDKALQERFVARHFQLMEKLKAAYYQVGTLGGGNHFIEPQEDEQGKLGIMIHSGSRHLGACVCDYFHNLAKSKNEEWYSSVPKEYKLAFLPTDSLEGKDYLDWMQLALDLAYENREAILIKIKSIIDKVVKKHLKMTIAYDETINCHHNYASYERHYKENVWVHRKGAISAKNGEFGIIPGAMGSYSYIVLGKGEKTSFTSASHGAGRLYSRKESMRKFSLDKVLNDLKNQGVVLGKVKKKDVPEEARFSYKDIDEVINNELDLITPIKKLKTIGVVKG